MLPTSDKYKQAIKEQTREFKRLVEILVYGSLADFSNTITSEDIAEITDINNAVDRTNTIVYNYASLEQNYTQLDGTFILPNKNFTNEKTGFIGDINSGSIVIQAGNYLFESQYYNGSFPILFYKEYPINFEVVFRCRYNNGSDIYFNQTYTYEDNNNDYILIDLPKKYIVNDTEYNYDVTKVTITINEWSNPNHRFRIRKVPMYETVVFEDDEIISLKLLEQTDFTNTELPSNSLSMEINNYDRKFNITKLDNILNKLSKQSIIRCYNGLIIDGCPEYIYLGGYNYSNYKENENKIVELNCSGIIEGYGDLSQHNFTSYTGISSTALSDVSLNILDNNNISNITYQGNMYAMYSNFSNRKEQAQATSIYYNANIKEQRGQNNSNIYGNKNELVMFNIDKHTKKTINLTEQTKNPILTKFIKTKRIVFNNKQIKNLKDTYTEIYNDDVNFIQSGTSIKAIITLDNLSVPISKQNEQVKVYNGGTQITSFGYLSSASLYYYKIEITIPNSTAGTRKVIINLKEYETTDVREEIVNNNIEDGASIEYNNIFINDRLNKDRVANFLFENEMDYRFETEILGDPSLEVGDTIILESVDGYHRATIDKIDSTDDGGYISRIEGVCSNVL